MRDFNLQEYSTIMVVDDEPTNLRVVGRMLKKAGYTNVILIKNPLDVFEVYKQNKVDLILLDINMPQMDGFQVMQALSDLDDPMLPPVIFLTAQEQKEYRIRALSMGARDFIGKPFDMDELLMRVKNLLQAHLSVRLIHEDKSVLEQLVKERTQDLYRSRLNIVQRLGKAAEYKDEETGDHILRVSNTAALIAKTLGWSDDQAQLIFNAAPMHDIGKIGVPDHILLKPGKLTPDEWEVMKSHTLIGAELLAGGEGDLMLMAYDIALYHHEKWDGNGYPHGTSGTEIPMAARIVAVADVFDALTSDRPYKTAWPIDDAVKLIRESRGTHFDPQVVDAFIENLSAVIEYRSSQPAQATV